MVGVSISQRGLLERRSPTLFVIGGGLVVGHAALRGIEAFTGMATPPDVFGPTGYLVALVGLFGLYPALADRMPTLARVAAVVAAIPLMGWVVISAWSFGEVAGVLPSQSEAFPGVFYMVHLVTVILTYGLFGVATLRTDVHSGTVGVLLLMPPALFIVMITGAAIVGTSAFGAFLIGSGLALIHLAIGATLRTGSSPANHETPAEDVTMG